MIQSFFESIKHIGHLIPLSFLRIFLGYYYLQQMLLKYSGEFLKKPLIANQLSEWLQVTQAPYWIKIFVSSQLIPHWQIVAFVFMGVELSIAVSYLLGYVVRPTAIMAALLSFFVMTLGGSQDFYRLLMTVHLILAWAGAGRCLGMDYYFFKRRRGLWW